MKHLFCNGSIYPLSDALNTVEALLVENDKILFTGSKSDALAMAGPDVTLHDLAGKSVLPGFIEAHMHILNTATIKPFLDLTPFSTKTFEEARQKLSTLINQTEKGKWVVAFGYDPSLISGPPEISVQALDELSTEHPLFVLNLSGHIAYVNSLAYKQAGVTKDTPDPVGGRFMKNQSGELSGIVEEVGALAFFIRQIPQPSPEGFIKDAFAVAEDAASNGCTMIVDAGVGDVAGEKDIEALKALVSNPQFPVRISGFLTSLLLETWKKFDWFKPDSGDDRLRFSKIKIWSDGSLQGLSGALRTPYLNSESKGYLNYKTPDLEKIMREVHDLGWPISVHCNGDGGLEQSLDVLEQILTPGDAKNVLHRIEHCTVAGDDLLARMKRLGITPSFTNGHVYYWGKVFRDTILGQDRAEALDPADFFVTNNLPFSYNSDAFTTPIRPLQYVQTAVTRVMKDSDREVLGPTHCISLEQALKAITIYPAMQLGIEDRVGTLEKGKYADLVILEKDPLKTDPHELSEIPVIETWMNGEVFSHTTGK